MADAKRCDICRKFYNIYRDYPKQPEEEWRPRFEMVIFTDTDTGIGTHYELCPECQNKFVNFMAGLGKWSKELELPNKEEN